MASSALDVSKLDLYKILNVDSGATQKEILKSYRKQALKCHPDKNPDNPNAAELFYKLSKALEILSDAAARAAYDKAQKAKKAAEERNKLLDSKRKKFKEDLEARESGFQSQKEADLIAKKNLEAEIERLRKEGSKMVEKEEELLRQEILREKSASRETSSSRDTGTPKLKIKWKAKKSDTSNGGYSYSVLYSMFIKYGNILNLLVSSKRNGSAILEMDFRISAEAAVAHETGLEDNPLIISWLEGHSSSEHQVYQNNQDGATQSSETTSNEAPLNSGFQQQDTDFENLVLMKMRQAQERKRLIQEIQEEDDVT